MVQDEPWTWERLVQGVSTCFWGTTPRAFTGLVSEDDEGYKSAHVVLTKSGYRDHFFARIERRLRRAFLRLLLVPLMLENATIK